MNEPWFDPNTYAWIPGTFFGTLCGLWGACAGLLAPQGKARRLILASSALLVLVAVLLLVASVIAFFSGQPYGIWYGLGLPGLIGLIVMPSLFPVILLRYRQAEQRKLEASDLS